MQLPQEFIHATERIVGEESSSFFAALEEDVPVSIRLNPAKKERNPLSFSCDRNAVPWSENGFYLHTRPAFTFDPLFHAGYYYVQEASSMFIEYVIRQLVDAPCVCLDLCAAPGGKSVSMLTALPEGSLLVSNEIVHTRAHVLAETMTKFGNARSVVCNNAPRDFAQLPHLFDVILVDAPCSGEGMFRKDAVAIEEWSPENVRMCAERQRTILRDVWDALKPDGILIYSTCTYNLQENEENARWIAQELGAEFITVPVEESWGITPSLLPDVEAYRFFPHKTKGEGLFVTVLRKKQESSFSDKKNKKRQLPAEPKDKEDFRHLLRHPASFLIQEEKNRITAIPKADAETIGALKASLHVLSMGVELGERKGKSFIPSHALAMSVETDKEAFPLYELDYRQAIAFLRSEAITLTDAPTGFVLLTYQHEPLGFVKNIGNRANNLYPKEWRIRSGYVPENRTDVFQ